MHPYKLFRSFAFRHGLGYLTWFAFSALVLLGFIYWYSDGYLARQTDAIIEAEITAFAEHYERAGLVGLQRLIDNRLRRQRTVTSSLYLLSDRRRALAGNLNRWPTTTDVAHGAWINFRLEAEDGNKQSVARARVFRLRGGYRLLVGRDLHDLQRARVAIGQALIAGLLVMLLLGLGGALLSGRASTRRIERINRACRAIMKGDLTQRIEMRGSDDDLDRLIATLNQMLDRIQELMEGVRRVSDNIAHDLRTPLARLRNRLEAVRALVLQNHGRRNAGDKDDNTSEIETMLGAALSETDSLLSTFKSLLRIVHVETHAATYHDNVVDLSKLLSDMIELYQPLTEERGQRIITDFAEVACVRGDHDLLFQTLANLLDNAVKFTPRHGCITLVLGMTNENEAVTCAYTKDRRDDVLPDATRSAVKNNVSCSARAPFVIIADSGPGIPVAMRDKVFQRFFRLEASRSTEGNGLGLSLVKAVADHHGIQIVLEDNLPGLRVVLKFAESSVVKELTAEVKDGAEERENI